MVWRGFIQLDDGRRAPEGYLDGLVLRPDAWDWIEDTMEEALARFAHGQEDPT